MKIVCVIPARINSKRFPLKVLSMLGDKPMLQWIWESAHNCSDIDEVIFAIDDQKTAQLIESFQGSYTMTATTCQSGTERLIEVQKLGKIKGDIWVNWQGDEPFIHSEMIKDLLQTVNKKKFDIYSLKKQIKKKIEIADPNTVKVVTDKKGQALYFSRSPIPYYFDTFDFSQKVFYKHIGIYAYTNATLDKMAHLKPTSLELAERLEQLRFLENRLSLQVHTTQYDSIGIDTPEDLAKAADRVLTYS